MWVKMYNKLLLLRLNYKLLQLQVAWEEIMKRFRHVEVMGEPTRVCSNIIHGYASLPVRLHRW